MIPKLINNNLYHFENTAWQELINNPAFLMFLRTIICILHEHPNNEVRETLSAIIENLENIKIYISDELEDSDYENYHKLKEEINKYMEVFNIKL